MKKLVLLISIFLPTLFFAQNVKNDNAVAGENAEYEFSQLDVQPEFPDGNNGLAKYLSENIKYPKKALKNGISGKVFVQFVIDKTGKVTNVNAVRGVEKSLDKEAVKVVKSMPRWKPGMKGGEPVAVRYTIPINFKF